ncbi:MAG: hypothetical protein M1831_000631 [Alyxoria varia]|nr:MAG: hypothetical protein M1831_000631 [Alyxoria varia]
MPPFRDVMADLEKKHFGSPEDAHSDDERKKLKFTGGITSTLAVPAHQKPRPQPSAWLFEPKPVVARKVLVKKDPKINAATFTKVETKTTETAPKEVERKKLSPVPPSQAAAKPKTTQPSKAKNVIAQANTASNTQKKRRIDDVAEAGPSALKKTKVENGQPAGSNPLPRDPIKRPTSWKELKEREQLRKEGKLPEANISKPVVNEGPRKLESNLERTIADYLRVQRSAKEKSKRDNAIFKLAELREAGKYDPTGEKAPDGTGKKGWTKKRVEDLMAKLAAIPKQKAEKGPNLEWEEYLKKKEKELKFKNAAWTDRKAFLTKQEKKTVEQEHKKEILRKKREERQKKWGPVTYQGTARPSDGPKFNAFSAASPQNLMSRATSEVNSGSNSYASSRRASGSGSSFNSSRRSSDNPDWDPENIRARARPNGNNASRGLYGSSRPAPRGSPSPSPPAGNGFWDLADEEEFAEREARKEDAAELRREEAHQAWKRQQKKKYTAQEQKLMDIKEGKCLPEYKNSKSE